MTMIQITPTSGEGKIFKNSHEACEYINAIERQKARESGERRWMFIRRPHQTFSALYYRSASLRDFFTPKEKEAVERELGLIEILKGDRENFLQILLGNSLVLSAVFLSFKKTLMQAQSPLFHRSQELLRESE